MQISIAIPVIFLNYEIILYNFLIFLLFVEYLTKRLNQAYFTKINNFAIGFDFKQIW